MSDGATEAMLERRLNDVTPDEWNRAGITASQATLIARAEVFDDDSIPEHQPTQNNALQAQVGGNHYKKLKIQPVEYIMANNLGFCEGSAIKYITRWRDKGGVQDIDKAIHFLQILKASLE